MFRAWEPRQETPHQTQRSNLSCFVLQGRGQSAPVLYQGCILERIQREAVYEKHMVLLEWVHSTQGLP